MNSIIKKQLSQIKVADLSNYDSETRVYTIPKCSSIRMVEGNSYIVELDDNLLYPNPGDTFHINWNRGEVPLSKCMLVEVSEVNGKVVKVFGIGYDFDKNVATSGVWSGWLPVDRLKIKREV
jgi:hypothetical protein